MTTPRWSAARTRPPGDVTRTSGADESADDADDATPYEPPPDSDEALYGWTPNERPETSETKENPENEAPSDWNG